jgi:flavin reductase (DIM6/NTAB) family NADH-FMN oxidoreductase RutF
MKKEIKAEFLWHLDEVVLAFQTTIITTVDRDGRVNAAPFGLVYPFSTGSNPQILVGVNSRWHTAHNIEATGEFVINYASVALLEQVAETGLLYNEGVNELEKAGLTPLPALAVKPPRIEECFQHIECRLNQIIRPNENQMNFVGNIVAISINEELLKKSKLDRVKAADPLFLLGMDITTFTGLYGGINRTRSYAPPTVDVWEEG